jgi:site-specific DNA-methyltransferase (adenine-specific)
MNKDYKRADYEYRFPTNVLNFSNANRKGKKHPTQKPILLMEYLIKTYTNEGETVLDFTAGSFTTGEACLNTSRNCILIENDNHYFDVGTERINNIQKKLP